jgi:hypothetical protein
LGFIRHVHKAPLPLSGGRRSGIYPLRYEQSIASRLATSPQVFRPNNLLGLEC